MLVAVALGGSACTGRSPHSGHRDGTLFSPVAGEKPEGAEGETVTLDAAAIDADADELAVDLPGGAVTAKRDSVVRRGARDFTWFGRTPGRSNANVTVTVVGESVSASVDTDSGTVAAHSTGRKGVGLRTRLDPDVLKEESDPEVVPDAADVAAAAVAPEPEVSIQAVAVIDVLIVFNSAVLRTYPEPDPDPNPGKAGDGVKVVATNQIARANKSFTESQINLQYRLVDVAQVPDAEIASRSVWLSRDNITALRTNANDSASTVGRLRNQTGADLVQAWGTYPNVCGQGYQPSVSQNLGLGYGVSVIHNSRSCLEGQAVSHELGHNIGGGHDRITARRSSGGGDAYGMVDRERRFLTIMAYPQSCGTGCVQTYLYSNPNVRYDGAPTGVAGSVDNARVMNIVGPKVAANKAATR
jgi:hypothetical protein